MALTQHLTGRLEAMIRAIHKARYAGKLRTAFIRLARMVNVADRTGMFTGFR